MGLVDEVLIVGRIRNKLKKAEARYFASDNIGKYITAFELQELKDVLAEKFGQVLDCLLIDWKNDPNSKNTPRRLATMYVDELLVGRYAQRPDVTAFPNEGENAYTGMLVVRAEIKSLCAHHHQPMKGNAYIGIIPNHKVIGLSKYIRLAQWVARRLTLQEELCNMIAKEIMKAAGTENVGVYISATHGCVELRGVCAHSSLTQTTVLHGEFKQPDVKAEFFHNIALQEQYTGAR